MAHGTDRRPGVIVPPNQIDVPGALREVSEEEAVGLLTITEAAAYLGITPGRAAYLRAHGVFPEPTVAVRVTRPSPRYDAVDLDAWALASVAKDSQTGA